MVDKSSPAADESSVAASTSSQAASKLKGPAIAGGIAALALLAGFVVAWIQGNQRVQQTEDALGQKLELAHGESTALAKELRAVRGQVGVLLGYRQIHLAVLALEERNFGIAKEHVQQAGEKLRSISADQSAPDHAQKVSEVAKALDTWEPDVTQDVGTLRSGLLAHAERLDPVIGAQRK